MPSNKLNTKLLRVSPKQKEIIYLLYKFRFLKTNQIQKLQNHKNPKRIQSWLKDLITKQYLKRVYSRKNFEENTKPATYYLAPKARFILKEEKVLNPLQLDYIYQEHRRSKKFIEHSLSIADVYLYLLSQKDSGEELKFFTKTDLEGYQYFPQPLPDAFISLKGEDKTRRYFLDLFDEYTPPFVFRKRIKSYIEYAEESDWDENTDYAPLPSVLVICPNDSIKKHLNLYTKALLEKSYEDKLSLYLTTKTSIKFNQGNNIWQKVEL